MKKILSALLALGLFCALAGCAGEETEAAPEATATPTVEELQAASESDAAAQAEAVLASSTDAAAADVPEEAAETAEENAYETALEYIGLSVEELYAAIGEPVESEYAASCLQDNAEDGMLFYDGFYIWSLRTEDGEIIYQVYLND